MRNIDQNIAASFGRIKQFAATTDKNQGTVRAAAAGSGVGGRSVQEALEQFEILEASNTVNEQTNIKNYITQQYRQMDAIQANAQMQANQATPQPFAPIAAPQPVPTTVGPSLFSSLAAGASAGLGAYAMAGGFSPTPTPTNPGGAGGGGLTLADMPVTGWSS